MNAILSFKEQSLPKFTAHAPSKREELQALEPPFDPHLPLVSKLLENYLLKNAAALDNHYQGGDSLGDFFSEVMYRLDNKFTKHLTAKKKRGNCQAEEEDKELEKEREVLFGGVNEVGWVVMHDTRLFKVNDDIKKVLRIKLMKLCQDVRKTLIHLE
jgi:hypothetical protein